MRFGEGHGAGWSAGEGHGAGWSAGKGMELAGVLERRDVAWGIVS